MTLQERKIAFVTEFFRLQDEVIVEKFEKMLRKRSVELYKRDLKPMSLERFKEKINQSLDDSKNDRVLSSKALKSKYK